MREGEFKDGILINGILKGDAANWKNMDFVFKDGIGKGSYD